MLPNTVEIHSTSDFYQVLRQEIPGEFSPTAFGEILFSEDENIAVSFRRFIFSTGFELSLCGYTVKKDFEITWEPGYHALEFGVTYEMEGGDALGEPNIALRICPAGTRGHCCAQRLRKGEYLSVELFVSLSQLSNFIDVTPLNSKGCIEYTASMIKKKRELLDVIKQILQRSAGGDAQRLFYQAKSLELLSLLAPALLSLEQNSCGHLCREDLTSVKRAHQIIQEQYQEPLSIPRLAAMVYMNTNKLKTCFKATYGMTVHEAIIARKMEVAYHLVLHEGAAVKDAAISVGYSNQGHFIDLFRRHYGFTPGELLGREQGMS